MIGKRIRFIRKKRNMTMKHLGKAAGLPENSADIRVAQYESGQRTPKAELLGKLAKLFEVSPDAIKTPDLDTIEGVMHTLFILEDVYGLNIEIYDSNSEQLKREIDKWQGQFSKLKYGLISREEYDRWRYNYACR